MKSDDALLAAWEETLAQKRDVAAIFDTRGEVLRIFGDIESRARNLEEKIDLAAGQVEVHIASGASNYQTRILETGTTFAPETDGARRGRGS